MAQSTFHGDAARTGVYPTTGPQQLQGTKWTFKTDGPIIGSPSIANGLVYFGGFDGILYALDAETGQERWRLKTGEDTYTHNQQGFQSSPAFADGIIYVGCRDGHLYAVDAATGRKRWDYPTNKGWVNSTPAIRGGVVYAGTSDGYRFFALDAKTTDGLLYAIH